ncbi:uncharacterized protein TNCV_2806151 [Trichonephila clavipes]|nr:uncharacterized protein TNCV_2806151 [Trichonephila clavipes]
MLRRKLFVKNEGNKNIAVAVDGTWQKRGYTSLNGVVTVTSIDTVILWISYSRNHSSVQNMRQAIWAIFLHKLSTDEYPQHGFCPIGEDSWCGFKRLKHQIETLSLGVYDAVCSFNNGNVSKLKMLQKMGVEPGEFSVSAMKLLDRERLMKAIYAFSGRSKKIRKDKEEKERKKKIILRKISRTSREQLRKLTGFSPDFDTKDAATLQLNITTPKLS